MIKDILGFGLGTYEVKTKCKNCKMNQLTKIKKGNVASEVIMNGKCQRCGCAALEIVGQ